MSSYVKKYMSSSNLNEFRKTITERIYYYINYGSLHGFRYLSSERCELLGKLYWIAILSGCLFGLSFLLNLTWLSYQQDAININVDTSYLKWNNTFPAISVCIIEGMIELLFTNFVLIFSKKYSLLYETQFLFLFLLT